MLEILSLFSAAFLLELCSGAEGMPRAADRGGRRKGSRPSAPRAQQRGQRGAQGVEPRGGAARERGGAPSHVSPQRRSRPVRRRRRPPERWAGARWTPGVPRPMVPQSPRLRMLRRALLTLLLRRHGPHVCQRSHHEHTHRISLANTTSLYSMRNTCRARGTRHNHSLPSGVECSGREALAWVARGFL